MTSAFAGRGVFLHPKPRGIIQFIGAFIFGSFPAGAYRPLMQELHSRGFSIVLHRFPLNPFQFNHWDVALGLLERSRRIQHQIATGTGFRDTALEDADSTDTTSADRDFYLDPTNTC
jgi:hypothetical protein